MEYHSGTREYHSIIHKPIIAPEEHPVCRNTHSKNQQSSGGAPCVKSFGLCNLHVKQENKQQGATYGAKASETTHCL